MLKKEDGISKIFFLIAVGLVILGGGASLYFQKPAEQSPSAESIQENNSLQPKSALSQKPSPSDTPVGNKTIPSNQSVDKKIVSNPPQKPAQSNPLNQQFSRGNCQSSNITSFTASPINPDDLTVFIPLGQMVGGHVTPVDHQYFYPNGWRSGGAHVPVYAPADGFIVDVTRYSQGTNIEGLPSTDGYDIIIEHSCTLYSKLGLLTGISEEVAKKLGPIKPGEQKSARIPVKANQIVAQVGGQSLDFFTYDLNTPSKKWIVLSHYNEHEGLKKFINDGLLYLTEPVKSKVLAKNPRTLEPRGGRFDYDIDGRLVGTWFLQGTNGYIGGDPTQQGYWRGHLVFAYNEIDPTSIEISMGSWKGQTQGYQFTPRNNAPDPKDISVGSGIIKYELTYESFIQANGERWNRETYAGPVSRVPEGETAGTMLVQMVSDRLVKVEKVPGKKAEEVTGFSSAAEFYER